MHTASSHTDDILSTTSLFGGNTPLAEKNTYFTLRVFENLDGKLASVSLSAEEGWLPVSLCPVASKFIRILWARRMAGEIRRDGNE